MRELTRFVSASATLASVTISALAVWIVGSNAIDIIGMDMNVMFGVQRILLGHALYADPTLAPYSITQYTPGYYYLAALPAAVLQVSGQDVLTVAALARFVSLVVAFAIAVLCFRILRDRVGASRRTSAIATVFIMCATANWYFAIRPDGLSSLFILVAVHIVTGAEEPTRSRLLAAAASAVAAVMTKQSGVIAGAILIGYLLLVRRFANAAIATAMMLALTAVSLFAMTAAGSAIRANVVQGVDNGIAPRAALMNAYRPVYYWLAPLIALCFAAVPRLVSRSARPIEKVLGVGAPIAFVFAAVTALKFGSAENYFNDFVILAVFAVVCSYVTSATSTLESTPRLLSVAFSLFLGAFLLIRAGRQVYTTYLYHRKSPETRLTSQTGPVDYVRREIDPERYAIGFAVGLSNGFPERMIVPQKELAMIFYTQHKIDYSRFVADVSAGKVQYAIIPNGERVSRFLGAPFQPFKPVRRFNYYTVYQYASPIPLAPRSE